MLNLIRRMHIILIYLHFLIHIHILLIWHSIIILRLIIHIWIHGMHLIVTIETILRLIGIKIPISIRLTAIVRAVSETYWYADAFLIFHLFLFLLFLLLFFFWLDHADCRLHCHFLCYNYSFIFVRFYFLLWFRLFDGKVNGNNAANDDANCNDDGNSSAAAIWASLITIITPLRLGTLLLDLYFYLYFCFLLILLLLFFVFRFIFSWKEAMTVIILLIIYWCVKVIQNKVTYQFGYGSLHF